jgi:hypothetical protein
MLAKANPSYQVWPHDLIPEADRIMPEKRPKMAALPDSSHTSANRQEVVSDATDRLCNLGPFVRPTLTLRAVIPLPRNEPIKTLA